MRQANAATTYPTEKALQGSIRRPGFETGVPCAHVALGDVASVPVAPSTSAGGLRRLMGSAGLIKNAGPTGLLLLSPFISSLTLQYLEV